MTSDVVNHLSPDDALRCRSLVFEMHDDVVNLILDAVYSRGPLDDDSHAVLNSLINDIQLSHFELAQQLLDAAFSRHAEEVSE